MANENVVPMNKVDEEIVKPIILRIPDRNEEYTLEFNRESVKFAESRGFVVDDVGKYVVTGLEDIFWYSFRMHHMSVSRDKAMKILYEDMKGFPDGMVERLGKLYGVPMRSLQQSESDAKNSRVTVEM